MNVGVVESIGIFVKCIIHMAIIDELAELKRSRKMYWTKLVLLTVNFGLCFFMGRIGVRWNILATILGILGYCIYFRYLKSAKALEIYSVVMAAQIIRLIGATLTGCIAFEIDVITKDRDWDSQLLVFGYLLEFCLLYLFCRFNKKYKLQQILKRDRARYIIIVIGMLFLLSGNIISICHEKEGNVILYIALTILFMGMILGLLWLIDWYYDEKEKKLLWEDNRQMSQRIHRSKEILPALSSVLDNLKTDHDTEEVYNILGEIHQLCEEQMEDYKALDSQSKIFPATGIYLLDEQIQVYNTEAGKKGIQFDVFVSEPLSDVLKQRKIKELDFLRLIGDLMRNAFRSIEKKEDGTGNILLVMGVIGDILQIDIYDDGVAFPLFILDEFGKRGNTEGGTGNGITDMLELLEKHKATYQLTEYGKEDTFTKGISIIWDGKNERWIDSYRNSEISNKSILLPKEF